MPMRALESTIAAFSNGPGALAQTGGERKRRDNVLSADRFLVFHALLSVASRLLGFGSRDRVGATSRKQRIRMGNMAVDGTWNISIETPIGTRQATLSIAAAGNELTGTQAADGNSTSITDGKVDGNKVSWKVAITNPMPMTLEFSGTRG